MTRYELNNGSVVFHSIKRGVGLTTDLNMSLNIYNHNREMEKLTIIRLSYYMSFTVISEEGGLLHI